MLDRLLAVFPDLPLLESQVSNADLAASGMLCGITVYGTVAHELAYYGIPTIACARHPHHTFDFCRTARTIEEYSALLASPGTRPLDGAAMRRQALGFYYMHNLAGDMQAMQRRRAFVSFWQACNRSDAGTQQFSSTLSTLDDALSAPSFLDSLALTGAAR